MTLHDFLHGGSAPGENRSGNGRRYSVMWRNISLFMALSAIVPLVLMAGINYHLYEKTITKEVVAPMGGIANKTRNSVELYLRERLSAVNFIASAYSLDQLSDPSELQRIAGVLREEFESFVDLGIINEAGIQIRYAGPYGLEGYDYSEQPWLQEVRVRGSHISDVFLGYRNFPHFVIAVRGGGPGQQQWVLRATINTTEFSELLESMGIGPEGDAFLINREGVLQTRSKYFGNVLDKIPFLPQPESREANVVNLNLPGMEPMIMSYVWFPPSPGYILVTVRPSGQLFGNWYTLQGDLLAVFLASVALILAVIFSLTGRMIRRIRISDEERAAAFREMEHNHKLSSIGRLAAGVAHEINNPLAVISEKAGLMQDLLRVSEDFPKRDRMERSVTDILGSVERCSRITHRLLGFARRMEVQCEELDINDVVREVLGFLEKEALHRGIDVSLNLKPDLPLIVSDRGQLQQVFLNIINNAFAAVDDGGRVAVTSEEAPPSESGARQVRVSIADNGSGMSPETLQHIFDPFFTTKRDKGTGLGLAITYGIVTKLHGRVDVESRPGEGSCFTITLPIGEGLCSGGLS